MDLDNETRSYSVKGGKTFLGALFQYQERTGASLKEIKKLPYIQFIIGMVDAPSIDYEKKTKKEKTEISDKQEEINALAGFLR